MKQMIESAFSFEMSKQNVDFSELFFYYVSGQDYLTNGKRLNDFLTTKNIFEKECLESVRIDNLYKEEKRWLIGKNWLCL